MNKEKYSKLIWIQCTARGEPVFLTASESKLESRRFLHERLYTGEEVTYAEIKAEGWQEKQFLVTEVITK